MLEMWCRSCGEFRRIAGQRRRGTVGHQDGVGGILLVGDQVSSRIPEPEGRLARKGIEQGPGQVLAPPVGL